MPRHRSVVPATGTYGLAHPLGNHRQPELWPGCGGGSSSGRRRQIARVLHRPPDQELGAGLRCDFEVAEGVAGPLRGFRPAFTLQETPLEETLPFCTVRETLVRNVVPAGAANTSLVPGATGVTEVVLQLFQGAEAFLQATVINGSHNWPTPTTAGNPPVAEHFNATSTIVEFWRRHAGLP
jgi:hypothetical protein